MDFITMILRLMEGQFGPYEMEVKCVGAKDHKVYVDLGNGWCELEKVRHQDDILPNMIRAGARAWAGDQTITEVSELPYTTGLRIIP